MRYQENPPSTRRREPGRCGMTDRVARRPAWLCEVLGPCRPDSRPQSQVQTHLDVPQRQQDGWWRSLNWVALVNESSRALTHQDS